MKKNLLLSLFALVLLATMSCNKAGKTGLLVPKDAAFVLHINMTSLSSKLSWDEISQTSWYKELNAKEDKDSLSAKLLANPEASGIDLKGKHVMFLSNAGNSGYFAFVGSLKDAAAYEKTITEMSKGKVTITKDGDYTVGRKEGDDEAVMIWNKSNFIIIANAPMNKMAEMGPMGGGGAWRKPKELGADTLQVIAKSIFNLEGEELLDSDKRFANLIKEDGDLHLWMNSEKIYGSSMGGMMSMMKVDALFKGNLGTASLSFDNGKIVIKANQYFGKEITDLVKKYEPKNVSSDVINRLPSSDVLAAGVFNYPPEGLSAMLKLVGVDGMVNGFLGEVNYSMEEFIKANKGDIAFAIKNFELKRDSVEYEGLGGKKEFYPREEPNINFVAGVSVNDKEAFNKLIGVLTKEMKNMVPDQSKPAFTYKMDNNWFAVGRSDEDVAAFLTGNNKPNYADKISGHQGGFYFDIQRALQVAKSIADAKLNQSSYKDVSAAKTLDASIAFWQDAVAYGDFKNGVGESRIEITLVDKNTNSLKQLNKYIDQLASFERENRKAFMNDYLIDSVIQHADTVATPPAVR